MKSPQDEDEGPTEIQKQAAAGWRAATERLEEGIREAGRRVEAQQRLIEEYARKARERKAERERLHQEELARQEADRLARIAREEARLKAQREYDEWYAKERERMRLEKKAERDRARALIELDPAWQAWHKRQDRQRRIEASERRRELQREQRKREQKEREERQAREREREREREKADTAEARAEREREKAIQQELLRAPEKHEVQVYAMTIEGRQQDNLLRLAAQHCARAIGDAAHDLPVSQWEILPVFDLENGLPERGPHQPAWSVKRPRAKSA